MSAHYAQLTIPLVSCKVSYNVH